MGRTLGMVQRGVQQGDLTGLGGLVGAAGPQQGPLQLSGYIEQQPSETSRFPCPHQMTGTSFYPSWSLFARL